MSTVDDLVLPAQYATGDVLVRAEPVEVKDVDDEKRIIDVKVMTYEREAQIDAELYEIFAQGAFKAALSNPSRVKVSDQQHERRTVVGQAVELREEGNEMLGRLRIADTTAGRDLLTLLREKILEELSVEFRAQPRHFKVTRTAKGLLVRHDKAVLVGISPVTAGAYGDGSRVLAVREEARNRAQERAIAELAAMTSGTETITRLR